MNNLKRKILIIVVFIIIGGIGWNYFYSNTGFVCGVNTVIDVNGRHYKTTQIGEQCWMAENLNVGTRVDFFFGAQDNTPTNVSDNNIIEKYCDSNDDNSCVIAGGLYNWEEAMNYNLEEGSQGICPVGWHIPSDEEYKTLEITLGMSPEDANLAGWNRGTKEVTKQLKNEGTSGFNASPSKIVSSIMDPSYLTISFWTSTEELPSKFWWRDVWYRSFDTKMDGSDFERDDLYMGNTMYRSTHSTQQSSMSIRCVKNIENKEDTNIKSNSLDKTTE